MGTCIFIKNFSLKNSVVWRKQAVSEIFLYIEHIIIPIYILQGSLLIISGIQQFVYYIIFGKIQSQIFN